MAAITPYNVQAIIMAFQKLIPALMAGNSVILRPSPLTPLSSLAFGRRRAAASGLPSGVLSVVVERGASGAELLTSDTPRRHVVSSPAPQWSADLRQPLDVERCVGAGGKVGTDLSSRRTPSGGPGCGAGRHHDRRPGVCCGHPHAGAAGTEGLGARSRRRRLFRHQGRTTERYLGNGGPPDHGGAAGAMRAVRSLAEERGAKVVCGGGRPSGLERGFYFEPTVLDVPDNPKPAAQEEIFGPVLAVIGYKDVDDAVRIANDSIYGLSGQVYGADPAAATAVDAASAPAR